MKYILLLTYLLLVATIFSEAQSTLSLDQQWTFSSYGEDNLGLTGVVTSDLDKNDRLDIIATSTATGSNFSTWGMFTVIEFDPTTNTYKTKWTSRLYFQEITEIQVYDINNDGTDEIFLGFANGEIRVLNGQTFKEQHSFSTKRHKNPSYPYTSPVTSIAFGDIDNDGTPNLVATNGDTTLVYTTSFLLKKRLYMPGGAITLANIDGDAAIESIYAKGQVVEYSVNGKKDELKFFPAAYGNSVIRTADMNNDGIQDLLYSSNDSVHVINVLTKSRIRSFAKKEGWGLVTDFKLYDYTLDGIPDIFIGNEQHDVLFVYDGLTKQLDYSIQDPKRDGLASLVIAELDDQPGLELLWTSGARCSCSDHFFVYDMDTRELKWMSKHWTVDFQAFDIGNIDDDARDELVIGSFGHYGTYYDHGFLSTLDLTSKAEKRATTEPPVTGYGSEYTLVRIGDIDNDGKNEILMGAESSYSFARVTAVNEYYNVLQTFDIDGMSYIADVKVADVDNDGENEVVITGGTNVAGSTYPLEWQNYVYIFDGKTGNLEWRSEQLAAMSSRLGNILVGNIDNDPAKEIILLRYDQHAWNPLPSSVFVIDGWTYELKSDESFDYTSVDVTDFDEDGTDDIIAGTADGRILVLDGESFIIKRELLSGQSAILSLQGYDINGDNVKDYVFTNPYQLFVFDPVHSRILAQTDTLDNRTGQFGALKIRQVQGSTTIFLNTSHTLYQFRLNVLPDVPPSPFALLAPINNAQLPFSEWLEFSWEAAYDDTPVTYTIHISGNGLDEVVSRIPQTHIVFSADLFELEDVYSWTVVATDNLQNTQSETFSFKLTDVVMDVKETIASSYKVYPNPFQANLIIHNSTSHSIEKIVITDVNGVMRAEQNVYLPAFSELSVEGAAALPPGIYLCTLSSEGIARHTVKLIKY